MEKVHLSKTWNIVNEAYHKEPNADQLAERARNDIYIN